MLKRIFEDDRVIELKRFEQLIQAIRSANPSLQISVDFNHDHVHALADMPKQLGLDFDVSLNLQNRDELHICIGHFWCEWFPCSDQLVSDRFTAAVLGVLSGQYRVIEQGICKIVTRAVLQKLEQGCWTPVARSMSGLAGLVPWWPVVRILQNRSIST